jgi:hypothetical protein
MVVYISGKMTGLEPEIDKKNFQKAKEFLQNAGYDCVNPIDLNNSGVAWIDAMKVDITELMQCNAIAMLPNWKESKEATIEHYIAFNLGLKVFYLIEISGNLILSLTQDDALLIYIEKAIGITSEMIRQDTKNRNIADARKIYSKIAREIYNKQWEEIATTINRDHSTAQAARNKANILLQSDKAFYIKYDKVFSLIKSA